jgi:hypothetical protein
MLGRAASLVHSARAATGVMATLPAHICDVRVRDATAATVGTRWTTTTTTTTTMSKSLTRTTRTQTMEAKVGKAGDAVAAEAGVGNARGGGTNGSIGT